jgi:hypothetical protein
MSDGRAPTGGRAGTAAELALAKQLQATRAAEGNLVQASASKWQAGTAALLALVTGAVGVGLRTTLITLEPAFAVAIGVLMLVALVMSITAALLGLYAAIGLPRLIKTAPPTDPEANHRHVKTEWKMLLASITMTVVALVVLLIAMTLTWWAPAQPAGDLARIVAGTTTVCGNANVNGTELIVTAPDGSVRIVQMSAITSWKRVTACP